MLQTFMLRMSRTRAMLYYVFFTLRRRTTLLSGSRLRAEVKIKRRAPYVNKLAARGTLTGSKNPNIERIIVVFFCDFKERSALMFCPQCGANQSDELKFCKLCGANLQAVRQAVATREQDRKLDWDKTWLADMFLSEPEQIKRQQEIERLRGITPEVKRYNEIKAGVITSSVGAGVMLFLYFFMQGIVLSGQNTPGDAIILGRVWLAGVIPFFIGLGLIINGLFVSKGLVKLARQQQAQLRSAESQQEQYDASAPALRPGDTTEFIPTDYSSVTEGTTRHLTNSDQKP